MQLSIIACFLVLMGRSLQRTGGLSPVSMWCSVRVVRPAVFVTRPLTSCNTFCIRASKSCAQLRTLLSQTCTVAAATPVASSGSSEQAQLLALPLRRLQQRDCADNTSPLPLAQLRTSRPVSKAPHTAALCQLSTLLVPHFSNVPVAVKKSISLCPGHLGKD